jgi:hypothetical protein
VLLESWAGEILDSIMCAIRRVLNSMRDVINKVVDTSLIVGAGDCRGADQVHKGLDALHKSRRLVFKVIL